MVALLLAAAIGSSNSQAPEWTTPHKVVIKQPAGEIDVYLPNHLYAGRTISGSVFAVPNGEDWNTQHKNQEWLDSYSVQVEGQEVTVGSAMFTCSLPKDKEALSIRVSDGSHHELGGAELHIASERERQTNNFSLVPVVEAGAPVAVFGPFDGDRKTTYASFGGRAVGVLAESDDECYITSPGDHYGASTLKITKNGQSFSHQVSILGFTFMTPAKPTKSGANTSVGVEVDGLQNADPSVFPILVELATDNPRVMRFQGPDPGIYRMHISAQDVQSGHVLKSVPIKARASGQYSITGSIHGQAAVG